MCAASCQAGQVCRAAGGCGRVRGRAVADPDAAAAEDSRGAHAGHAADPRSGAGARDQVRARAEST